MPTPWSKKKDDESCDCGEKAEYVAALEIRCEKCLWIKKIPITLKATVITALLAYGGSQFIDYGITDNRYPINIEYAVMNACVNGYNGSISSGGYKRKEKICLCALEDTMNEISYIRYNLNKKGFSKAFRENTKECRE